MRQLTGKVAVVTGAASGIGRAMARAFALEGMRVVLADIDEAPLQAAVDELVAGGAVAISVPTDVSKGDAVESLASRTLAEFGAVHVVCNNAGVETGRPFAEIPVAAWEWVLGVNLWGVVHGCRVFLPLLREQGEGHIVNTGSVGSFAAEAPTFAPYVTTKFAILGLTESLDAELRADGGRIGISLLAPGVVRTQLPRAERLRPAGVPYTLDEPARKAVIETMEKLVATEAMEPDIVGAMVVDAIREDRFFVLPHPEMAISSVRNRLEWMETGVKPGDVATLSIGHVMGDVGGDASRPRT
ncbi:MAG TPA: SDR family NAD(P)-dependent oxidoreductase [Solirubrobacteraceae bacterium]|jgi:NAD(P)-dependent dehydrogenase (short-subunit alcohol dehydrogenase family)|nr:SDR family NAD(P)-dependent oxidoreductase [Solirubrobacteraceae bacterium]